MTDHMEKPLFDIGRLVSKLTPEAGKHTQILVPNRRLARHITSAWSRHCSQQGQQAWRQAPVQTLDTWLLECWQELQDRAHPDCFTHCIINPHAERLIWQQVIDNDADKPIGTDGAAFARLTQSAWQNLERWQVPLEDLAQSAHEASQLLLRWQQKFAGLLAAKLLLTPAQAQTFVLQAFQQGFLASHKRLVLVDFNTDLAPLYQKIIDAAFSEIIYWNDAENPCEAKQICITNNDADEIGHAAAWAKNAIDIEPNQRIGIVLPNLASQRHRIDRIFREVFTPGYWLPDTPHGLPPFNISAGIALSETALVASALNLLQLQCSPQPLEFYYSLLNDPFWSDAANEQIVRARCQVLLRSGYKLQPGSADLRFYMKRAEDELANTTDGDGHSDTTLSKSLQQFEDRCRRQTRQSNKNRQATQNTFAHWAEEFSTRLKVIGWPGSRTLDSIEYQQQQLWLDVLDELAGLDNAIDPVDSHTALIQLTRICRGRIFQPEGSDSPVQVLGVLEAAGLHFDQLWLAEMHDSQWPQAPDYNPLLPVRLQRLYKMPRSSAETELDIARKLLADFESHCKTLIFSFAKHDGDSERQISRLLEGDLPSLVMQPPVGHPLLSEIDKPQLQQIAIDQAPPLIHEDTTIRGGSAMLRDQARCPFNAFAIWRLGAEPLPEPAFGFGAMERGNLVHHALELFWAECQNSSTLNNMGSETRGALLAQSISTATHQAKNNRPDLFGPRFTGIENQRLHKLLSSWLDIEQSRDAFRVAAQEEKIPFQLGELNLSMRIDRIDQLEDGSVMLIDYKTGNANIKGFADERPEEPQLLLYALATNQPLSALCFGQVSASKGVALKGVTSQDNLTAGLINLETAGLGSTWALTLDLWRERLGALAKEFATGDAEAVFYSNTAASYEGYLLPLNRWLEINPVEDSDLEAGTGND